MRSRFLVLVVCCILNTIQINDVSSAGRRPTDFPYCYINGNVVHFGKVLKDVEACTIHKCKKGKRPIVEEFKCKGLDEGIYSEYVNWCVENNCETK